MLRAGDETKGEDGSPLVASTVDVLVVGAGPTGLAAACKARRCGLRVRSSRFLARTHTHTLTRGPQISYSLTPPAPPPPTPSPLQVRIVDKAERRSVHSKALVMHARTLESLPSPLARKVVESGTEFMAMNIFNKVKNMTADGSLKGPSTRVRFGDLDWGDTAFPFWLSIPQYESERLLEEHLGSAVEWGVGLETLENAGTAESVEGGEAGSEGTTTEDGKTDSGENSGKNGGGGGGGGMQGRGGVVAKLTSG